MCKSFNEYKNSSHLVNDKIKNSNELLTSLKEELSKFNEEKLQTQKSELENKKKLLEDELNNYILFFKENFEFDIKNLDLNNLSQYIESVDKDSKRILKEIEFIYGGLFTLYKNSEHISEFLQTEKTKIEIQTKEAELCFLKQSVRPYFEEEREKVKDFLEDRIKDFFYEKLINKLYCKIDPHPDFKEVEFRPNLDGENPRLDIYVKNSDSELIIPNLYFSTAQINILSLCIFLASALKSTEYDCILIDDPIQSMDSINVLSTIDLLRSIIVNNDKQIIISTHDENFHNLLKKKVPTELFKSKFLKLESFGKVVNDV